MSSPVELPLDHAVRERIRGALGESQWVEAAAGTGKTSVLVDRAVEVLARGLTTVDRLVILTFTRKAAGELKLRLRLRLDQARLAAAGDPEAVERHRHLADAVARLEEASIGTFHAFCAEILRARPIEAGIDPAFVELDEEASRQLFEQVFRRYIERTLNAMPSGLRRALFRLANQRDQESPLSRLSAEAWRLAELRDFATPWRREPFARETEIDDLVDRLTLLRAWRERGNPRDRLAMDLQAIAELAEHVARHEEALGQRDYDELEARLAALERDLPKKPGSGRGADFAPGLPRQEVQDALNACVQAIKAFNQRAGADLAAELREALGEVLAEYAARKEATGHLDFLDLLLRCRDLIRDRPAVCGALQERFSHLFVDELQDTDPLQLEVLLLLAADDPAERDWRRARPRPGRLFLVGDPQQSIYRFRRADVVLYLALKERLAAAGVAMLELNHSFRAVAPLQQALNDAFVGHLVADAAKGQAAYMPLVGGRPSAQPALIALPIPAIRGYRGDVNKWAIEESLPDAVATLIAELLAASAAGGKEAVQVRTGDGGLRPLQARDVCLLFRRFQSWGRDVTADYLAALEARGIPHLLVGGRSFEQREEVETLRAALKAIEWPDDTLSVYATLRGDLFGLPDDALLRYKVEVGALRPGVRSAADAAGDANVRCEDGATRAERSDAELAAIAEALDHLDELHRLRNQRPIAETLQKLLVHTRAHAGFALRPAGNQVLANVQRIADLARRFEQRAGLSFRGFVDRLDDAAEQGGGSSPMLEEGADGVRLMTVHNAKGLEFPVVLLADPTCRLTSREPGRHLDAERGLGVMRLLGLAPIELQEAFDLEQGRDEAEALRLTYVAATRARDALIVPIAGRQPGALPGSWLAPLDRVVYPAGAGAMAMVDGDIDAVDPGWHRPFVGEHALWVPSLAPRALKRPQAMGVQGTELLRPTDDGRAREGLERYLGWQAERQGRVDRGGVASVEVIAVSETVQWPKTVQSPGAEPTLERLARPDGRPRGRRFGTLLHLLFRDVPHLPHADPPAFDRDALPGLARLHGRLLGAPAAEVAAAVAAVAAALDSSLLRAAAAADELSREAPFTLRLDGDYLVEGIVDLAFRQGDAWTVVDFKTDDPDADPALLEQYRIQLAWYVAALESLHGQNARGVLLLV
jgi:ATP-dependent helicase/nuclease subunit A